MALMYQATGWRGFKTISTHSFVYRVLGGSGKSSKKLTLLGEQIAKHGLRG